MDEPTAPLAAHEVELLFSIIRKLKERGVTVVYISHRMDEVFQITERISVLRDGRLIKTLDTADTDRRELVSLMVGRELNESFPARTQKAGEVVLEARDLTGNSALAEKYRGELRIRVPGVKQMVVNLSGGNQQKVALAKALAADPDIIIFDEPTKGIDVGAKQEIYQLMNDLVESGKAIIMVSSDMEEILGMSDRIIVLHEGLVSGELMRGEFSQERVLQLASGV